MTTRFRCVDCNKTVFYCVKEKWTRKLIEFFHYNRLFTQARSTVLKKNRGKGGGISHHICYNFYLYVKFIFNFFTLPKTVKVRYMKISFYIQNLSKMSISKKKVGVTPPPPYIQPDPKCLSNISSAYNSVFAHWLTLADGGRERERER